MSYLAGEKKKDKGSLKEKYQIVVFQSSHYFPIIYAYMLHVDRKLLFLRDEQYVIVYGYLII